MPQTRIITRSRPPPTITPQKCVTTQAQISLSPSQRTYKSTTDTEGSNQQKHTNLRCSDQRSRHIDKLRVYQRLSDLIIIPNKNINNCTIASSSLHLVSDTSPLQLNKSNHLALTSVGHVGDDLENNKLKLEATNDGSITALECGKGSVSTDGNNVSDIFFGCNPHTSLPETNGKYFGSNTIHGSKVYLHKSLKRFDTIHGKAGTVSIIERTRAARQNEGAGNNSQQIQNLSRISHAVCVDRNDIHNHREDILGDEWGICNDRENIRNEKQDIHNDVGNIPIYTEDIPRDRVGIPCDRVDIISDRGDTLSETGDDVSNDKQDIRKASIGLDVVNVQHEPLYTNVSNTLTVLETDGRDSTIEVTNVFSSRTHAGCEVSFVHKSCCKSPEPELSCNLVSDVVGFERWSTSSNCACVKEPKEPVDVNLVKTSCDGRKSKPVISPLAGQLDTVCETLDPSSSGSEIEPTVSQLYSTSEFKGDSGKTPVITYEMTDMTHSRCHPPGKRKKRRRSKRAPAAKTDSLFIRAAEDTCPWPSHSHTDDEVSRASELTLQLSGSSIDQAIISKISSIDRLRLCSSPNFIYDPDIAGQIPFYFKNPEVEEWSIEHHSFGPGASAEGEQCDSDDDSSDLSWSEFDNDYLNDTWEVRGASVQDELSINIDSVGEDAYDSTSNSSNHDESISCISTAVSLDSSSEELEIDYDSYLPAHVLMHVKRDLVSVLMEYGQTREVKVSFQDMERSGPHHASRFHTAAIVDTETFPVGSGSSKKNAKKAAAAQALKIMYDRGRKNLEVVNEVAHKKLKAMSDEEVGSHAHRVVLVSRHVLDTAEETQFINYSKDKIAATFVLEYHGRMRVVGLGTGNRCMLYQHLTLDGKRVIHSHAEIIARRAFLRYLYKQLLTYNGNRSHPIFTRSDTGKLKLRDKIQVHLYISRPPCGDAAAFPTISNFPNKMRAIRKQGQLRTIIDDGEGAIPTDFPVPAGANGKERLRIMTCSDKICRWNVLGVQGAMLSHFLDPIYISSLVIGSHTGDQRGHVPRAVSGRLKCGRLHEVIQRPYHINTPDIHYPHDDLADNYNITKSKQYCITWSYGDLDAEVIDAITGVTNMESMEDVIPSRVAKITLYGLFQQVCNKYGQHDMACLDYLKAKRAATTFQRMKSFVGQHLAAMGFGQWYSLQDTYGTDSLTCPGPC